MKKLMILAAALSCVSVAVATDYTWSGSSGGSWTDEANWGGSGYPGSTAGADETTSDTATFNSAATVTIPSGGAKVSAMTVNAAVTLEADSGSDASQYANALSICSTTGITGSGSFVLHNVGLRHYTLADNDIPLSVPVSIPSTYTAYMWGYRKSNGNHVFRFNGKLTGDGELVVAGAWAGYGGVWFQNDSTEFAGMIRFIGANNRSGFQNGNATSASAVYIFENNSGSHGTWDSSTFKFGQLTSNGDATQFGVRSNNNTVEIGNSGDFTLGAVNFNNTTTTIKKMGSGTMTLGTPTNYGYLNLAAGTVVLNDTTSTYLPQQDDGIVFAGGTLKFGDDVDAEDADISAKISSASTGAISIDTNGKDITFASAFTATTGLTKSGEGTLTLDASNITGTYTVKTGTLHLTAAPSPMPTIVTEGTGRVTGAGVSYNVPEEGVTLSEDTTIAETITGTGTITIPEGVTLTITGNYGSDALVNNHNLNDVAFPAKIAGTGTLVVTGYFAYQTKETLSGITGRIVVRDGGVLAYQTGRGGDGHPSDQNTDQIFGNGSITLAGGTLKEYHSYSDSGTANINLSNSIEIASGTTNTIYSSNANIKMSGAFSGGGYVKCYCWGRGPQLSGDNSGFSGTMEFGNDNANNLAAGIYAAQAGSANAIFRLSNAVGNTSASMFLNVAASSELHLGAFDVDEANAKVSVAANCGIVVGERAGTDSTIEGSFINQPFTLVKAGNDSSLTLGEGFAMVEGSSIVVSNGTLTVNCAAPLAAAVTVANGAALAGTGKLGAVAFEPGAFLAFDGLTADPEVGATVDGPTVTSWSGTKPTIFNAPASTKGKWVLKTKDVDDNRIQFYAEYVAKGLIIIFS